VARAAAGAAAGHGGTDRARRRLGVTVSDHHSAALAVTGILAAGAGRGRRRRGEGRGSVMVRAWLRVGLLWHRRPGPGGRQRPGTPSPVSVSKSASKSNGMPVTPSRDSDRDSDTVTQVSIRRRRGRGPPDSVRQIMIFAATARAGGSPESDLEATVYKPSGRGLTPGPTAEGRRGGLSCHGHGHGPSPGPHGPRSRSRDHDSRLRT
jgi:hypothetical protein